MKIALVLLGIALLAHREATADMHAEAEKPDMGGDGKDGDGKVMWPPVFWRPPTESKESCSKDSNEGDGVEAITKIISALVSSQAGRGMGGSGSGSDSGSGSGNDLLDAVKDDIKDKMQESQKIMDMFVEVMKKMFGEQMIVKEPEPRDTVYMVWRALTYMDKYEEVVQNYVFMMTKTLRMLSGDVGQKTPQEIFFEMVIRLAKGNITEGALNMYNGAVFNFFNSVSIGSGYPFDRSELLGVVLDRIIFIKPDGGMGGDKPSMREIAERMIESITEKDSPLREKMVEVVRKMLRDFNLGQYDADTVLDRYARLVLAGASNEDGVAYLESVLTSCGSYENMMKAYAKGVMDLLKGGRMKRDAHEGDDDDHNDKCDVSAMTDKWKDVAGMVGMEVLTKMRNASRMLYELFDGNVDPKYMDLAMSLEELWKMLTSSDKAKPETGMEDMMEVAKKMVDSVSDKDSAIYKMMKETLDEMLESVDIKLDAENLLEEYSKMVMADVTREDAVNYMKQLLESCGGYDNMVSAYFKKVGEILMGGMSKRDAHDGDDDKCDVSEMAMVWKDIAEKMDAGIKMKVMSLLKKMEEWEKGNVDPKDMALATKAEELWKMFSSDDKSRPEPEPEPSEDMRKVAEYIFDSFTDKSSQSYKSVKMGLEKVLEAFKLERFDAEDLLGDYEKLFMGDASREDSIKYLTEVLSNCGGYENFMNVYFKAVEGAFEPSRKRRDDHEDDDNKDSDSCDLSVLTDKWKMVISKMDSNLTATVKEIFSVLNGFNEGKVDPEYMELAQALGTLFSNDEMDNYELADYKTIAMRILNAVGKEDSEERKVLVDMVEKFLKAFMITGDVNGAINKFRDTWLSMTDDQIVSYIKGLMDNCDGVKGAFGAIMNQLQMALNPTSTSPPPASSCDVTLFVSKAAQAVGTNMDMAIRLKAFSVLTNVTNMLEGKPSGDSMLAAEFRRFMRLLMEKEEDSSEGEGGDKGMGKYTEEELLYYVVKRNVMGIMDETSVTRNFWTRMVMMMIYDFNVSIPVENVVTAMNAVRDALSDTPEDELVEYFRGLLSDCGGFVETFYETREKIRELYYPQGNRKRRDAHCDVSILAAKIKGLADSIEPRTGGLVLELLNNVTDMLTGEYPRDRMNGRRFYTWTDMFTRGKVSGLQLLAGIMHLFEVSPLPIMAEAATDLMVTLSIPEWYDPRFMALYHAIAGVAMRDPADKTVSLATQLHQTLHMWRNEDDGKVFMAIMSMVNNTMSEEYPGLLALMKVLDDDDGDLLRLLTATGFSNPEVGKQILMVAEMTVMKGNTLRGSLLNRMLALLSNLPGDNSEAVRKIVYLFLSWNDTKPMDQDRDREGNRGTCNMGCNMCGNCNTGGNMGGNEGEDRDDNMQIALLRKMVETLVGSNTRILQKVISDLMGDGKGDYETLAERIKDQLV